MSGWLQERTKMARERRDNAADMKSIIWISQHLPYDSVGHAGGKIQNFYLNNLIDSGFFDLRLLSFYWDNEINEFTLDKKIKCYLIPYHSSGIRKIARNLLDLEAQRNPFNRYGNLTSRYLEVNILRTLRNEKTKGYEPDTVILQWTQTIFFAGQIKKIYPKSRIIGIEEDVSFQNYERRIGLAGSKISGYIAGKQYKNVRREELDALKYCDLVICNNRKDEKILKDCGYAGDIRVWVPYFQSMVQTERKPDIGRSVIFYGDMSRPENYLSAEWFAENVMQLLAGENIVFDIIGGKHPDRSLFECAERYQNVKVHGFVENISTYFSEALCLAAPLLYGAGIKVKVLEAMSAGLPVLTNDVGIEGIPAENMVEYLHCEKPDEYAANIRRLLTDREFAETITRNSREFIRRTFDREKSAVEFAEWLRQ